MKKQKNENNLIKENEKMNRQMVELSDEMLEQVSGGEEKPAYDCPYDSYCGKLSPCRPCPYVR